MIYARSFAEKPLSVAATAATDNGRQVIYYLLGLPSISGTKCRDARAAEQSSVAAPAATDDDRQVIYKIGANTMAVAKIIGGDCVRSVRLYHERNSTRGTKNLAQANTFRRIERLEKDLSEGTITEDEFAELQSDILTTFTEQWGDPTPPSEETPEQKQARRERKAFSKAEDEKRTIGLIAENGFVEGYTVILTNTFTEGESDRIKALDDPTGEVYNKIYKLIKEYLQYHYRADYGAELRLLTVMEEGEKSKKLHLHIILNTPFEMIDKSKETEDFLKWIKAQWKHYSKAEIVKAEVAHKVGGVWAIAPYMSKCFFDLEKHKKGKHYYWCTDNLRHLDVQKIEIPDDKVRTLFAKFRSDEDEAVEYIETAPEMENKRVLSTYFHDSEDRIDDITFAELMIANVTRDIDEGRLGKKRSAADVEMWQDDEPMFLTVKHYGEGVSPSKPIIPFDKCEWVADPKPREDTEKQGDRDNAPSAPLPRQRKITSLGLTWYENLPTPQTGRRIVVSNGLIFDELDTQYQI